MDTQTAGFCLSIGQLSDGIATPLIGYYSDKFDSRYGKRMIWFMVGYVIFAVFYASIFLNPPFITQYDKDGKIKDGEFRHIYFIVNTGIFNAGWAMC